MENPINHNAAEQIRVISEIFEYLSVNTTIGLEEYKHLVAIAGSGLATKLRLTPSQELKSRLEHLYALVSCASGITPIHEDQVILSFEGMSTFYNFDCDLVIEIDSQIVLVDFTSSKVPDIIKRKYEVLQNKTLHPSLIGKNVDIMVRNFEYVGFTCPFKSIVPDDQMNKPQIRSLKLLETFCNMSSLNKAAFLENCHEVLNNSIISIAESKEELKVYNPPMSSKDKVDAAITSVSSNNVYDTVKFLSIAFKKTYAPFLDCLKKISAQSHNIKAPFIVPMASINDKENEIGVILDQLSDDYLARVLRDAYNQSGAVCNIDKRGNTSLGIAFDISRSNKRMLSPMSPYYISARHLKGHYFEIYFSYQAMDKFMRRVYCDENYRETSAPKEAMVSIDSVLSTINEQEAKFNEISSVVNKRVLKASHSTIWDKILSLSRLVKSDLGNVGSVATNLLNSTSFSLSKTVGGSMVSHLYEVVKTFAASIKNSHKDETYYVGVNGAYKSVTVVKMSATQDSFDRAHYCVISRCDESDNGSSIAIAPHSVSKKVSRSKFRTLDTNEVSYLLRLPYYVASLLSWDIENSIVNGKILTSDIPEKLTSSILHCLVNRDLFAQASQQVRYLYMSSIGYGAVTADIAKKIDFLNPTTTWEYVYISRMIKMGLALSIVRDNGRMADISQNGELVVCFPHSSKPITQFSQVISSMYYCNIFNKFRAFHEVSEAFCYNELDGEEEIYKECFAKDPLFLAGHSEETDKRLFDIPYLVSREFVKNEVNFTKDLLKSGVGRFRFSSAIVIASANKFMKAPPEIITSMFESVSVSPIDACTMRGAMDDKPPTDKNQGIRAASAILEELFKKYDETPDALNNNSWLSNLFISRVVERGGDASIYSFVVNQLCDDTVEYFYRIVQKDQVGNREISVLNAVFRIGALFVENLSKTLSSCVKDVDLLENPDKDYVFEKSIQSSFEKHSDKIICYDNSDQKRWGPNHLLNSFCAMFVGAIPSEPGLIKLILHVASKVLAKKAKFPESLISLFAKMNKGGSYRITREGLDENHGSKTLKTFFSNNANDIFNNKYYREFTWGMCQGIFHGTSSIYHAIMCKVVEAVFFRKYGNRVIIRSFCTSDDASRIIIIDPNLNQIEVIKELHVVIRNVGVLFNILRNDAKSAFNFHVSEFNSIFFKKGIMATPTIKQRISKIDVGNGENHVEDYMACLSASSNYFTIGGSYAGAVTLSIINIALHTEQWNRWAIVNEPDQYFKPVELGGFPVVEPFSTCLAGAVSNLYLRASPYVTDSDYARVFSTIITENPEEIKLSDYHRVPKSLSEDANSIKIFKSTGALGIFSLIRTDKKLSQFENRHSLSKWQFPDSFFTLRKKSADPKHFLYQIYKNGCMSLFSESQGVNSFYKRFTDPWLSKDRICVKISKKSILSLSGLSPETRYSYTQVSEALRQIEIKDSKEVLKSFSTKLGYSEFANTLIEQLIPRLNDSKNILDFICSQECAEYVKPTDFPATSRITLRGSGALDQEKYTADLIKILSGEKSRIIISEIYRDYEMFDKLPKNDDCPNLDLRDSILIAENSVHAFDKYIKRNTKMITSGRPDTLSSLVTLILKNRFLEQLGVRLTGRISLIGDRSHAFSYTSWYKKLQEKSQGYVNQFVNNSAKALYSDVVKYGIKSSAPLITTKDHFEVMDYPDTMRRCVISAPSRSAISTYAKSWVSANAIYTFDFDTLSAFYDNRLLSHSEFRIGSESFSRCATGIYFDLKVNGLPTVHIIQSSVAGDSVFYKHFILMESTGRYVNPSIEVKAAFADRPWLRSLTNFIETTSSIISSTEYKLSNASDVVEFITFDLASSFNIEVLPYTSTLGIVSPFVIIPLCYSNVKYISELKAGYACSHSDFRDAAILFSNVIGEYEGEANIPKQLAKSLQYIMHKTNSTTKVKSVNDTLSNIGSNFSFTSSKQLDIFRSLLLSEGYGSKLINSGRLNQHVNNLFRSSPDKGSYLAATTLEDKAAFSLDDFLREDPDYENVLDAEYEEQDEPYMRQEDEANLFEDSDSDDYEPSLDLVELDDIDFDAFSDDEAMADGEIPFAELRLVDSSSIEDAVSLKSSRTGITVNPNQEFPYAIYNYLKRWSIKNPIKRFMGCPKEIETAADIAKLYLQIYQMSGSVSTNIIQRLTSKNSVEYPCPLSDLVVIKNTIS